MIDHKALRRILSHAEPQGDCLVWTSPSKTHNGYGVTYLNGRTILAHRAIWVAINGEPAPGLDVCHSCDNRLCVKFEHLWLGTRLDNMRDAARKGRTAHARLGVTPTNRVATPEHVAHIRAGRQAVPRKTYRQLMAETGLTKSTVAAIATRRWAYL